MPAIYLSDEPERDLGDYLSLYLREEVAAEAQVRNLPAFSRFLEVAALCNTFHELKAYVDASGGTLHYWRTTSQIEVDFVLDGRVAIEVKASKNIGNQDMRGLLAFAEEVRGARLICVCHEPVQRRVGQVYVWPVEHFLQSLWSGELR